MSRVGKLPVKIAAGVKVRVVPGAVQVEGPKGKLTQPVHPAMSVAVEGDTVVVKRPVGDSREHRALHGLTRTLIANAVAGVSGGFSRTLEIVGVGYKAQAEGKKVVLTLGYSHPVVYAPPEGIAVEVKENTTLIISGADKKLVGEVAAKLRSFRPPEPYKGKGIKYKEEVIRRKAGKTAAS